jgi:hypothetical protein
MESTIQLLDKALSSVRQTDPKASERSFSKQLGLSPAALSVARHRGNLSPIAAGQVALLLGENVEHWMAVAAIEAEPKSRATEQLRRMLTTVRNS